MPRVKPFGKSRRKINAFKSNAERASATRQRQLSQQPAPETTDYYRSQPCASGGRYDDPEQLAEASDEKKVCPVQVWLTAEDGDRWTHADEQIIPELVASHTAPRSVPPPEQENTASAQHTTQCHECGADVVGFHYRCVQCADCDLCAACEARGAHPDHYVLRIPRPLQLVRLQALVERVRGCLEAEDLVERGDSKEDIEKHYVYSDIKVETEEITQIKLEPMETAEEEGHQDIQPHDYEPETPGQLTIHCTPLTPTPSTHPKRKPKDIGQERLVVQLPTLYPLRPAPSIITPNPASTQTSFITFIPEPTESSDGSYTELGSHQHRQP